VSPTRTGLPSGETAKLPEPEPGKPTNEHPVASQEEKPAEQKTLLATGTVVPSGDNATFAGAGKLA